MWHLQGLHDFATISGLHLNLPKTVLVPLWPTTPDALRRTLRDDHPFLASIAIAFAAKYLGVWVGPEGAPQAWQEGVAKYRARPRRWAAGFWGMTLMTRIYNTYVFSVLSFVAQFYPPTEDVLETEREAIALCLPGPGA